jgi:hypothetical protein
MDQHFVPNVFLSLGLLVCLIVGGCGALESDEITYYNDPHMSQDYVTCIWSSDYLDYAAAATKSGSLSCLRALITPIGEKSEAAYLTRLTSKGFVCHDDANSGWSCNLKASRKTGPIG